MVQEKNMTYGKQISTNKTSAYQRNHNIVTVGVMKTGLGPISNVIAVILIICLLGLLYLTQVTKTNTLGYTINNLTTQQQQLQDQYASLQVQASRQQGLDKVQNSSVATAMQPVAPTATVTN